MSSPDGYGGVPTGGLRATVWNRDSVRRLWEGREGQGPAGDFAPEIVRLSRKYVGRKVLDVGAGSGVLIRRFPGAIGLDLAPRGPGVLRGDVCRMPFVSGAFDTVFATELLEHLPEAGLTVGLQEMRRVLKPGGRLIVATPYREDLSRHETVCPECGARFHSLGHVWSFDEATLSGRLRDAGFDVLEVRCLPLGFRGRHRFLGHFTALLSRMDLTMYLNLFVVSRRHS